MMNDGYVAEILNNQIMERIQHKKYDTSKVKTITLNGKKYIDMSVIEDIKAEIEDEIDKEFDLCVRHSGRDVLRLTCLKEFRSLIDRKVKECTHDKG